MTLRSSTTSLITQRCATFRPKLAAGRYFRSAGLRPPKPKLAPKAIDAGSGALSPSLGSRTVPSQLPCRERRAFMKVGIIVGLGLGIGIAFMSGCAPGAAEANAPPVPPAAAPTPLVPEAYTALPGAVAPAAAPPARTRLSPAAAPAVALEGRAMPFPTVKSDQYHPYWVVDVH